MLHGTRRRKNMSKKLKIKRLKTVVHAFTAILWCHVDEVYKKGIRSPQAVN